MTRGWAAVLVMGAIALGVARPAHSQDVVLVETVHEVWVHDVPAAPSGFWDSVLGNIVSSLVNPRTIYPDIRACVSQPNNYATCVDMCPDAELDAELGGDQSKGHPDRQCRRPINGERGLPLRPNDFAVRLLLYEVSPDGQRTIAQETIKDPAMCTHDSPCSFPHPKGPVVVSFKTETRGVLGRLPPAAPPGASGASGAPGAPTSTLPSWTPVWDDVKKIWQWYVDKQESTADAREVATQSAEASQRQVNSCLLTAAGRFDDTRSRLPMCANGTGTARETCLLTKVLNENEAAYGEGLKCQSFKQVQTDIDNIGVTAVLVWIKGYLCPVGQWFGMAVCGG